MGVTDNPNFKAWFRNSKVVDSAGNPLRVYHGTQRPDRIGNRFRKSRATSGPMQFFTESPEIAGGYATGKRDTSLEGPESYFDQFKFKPVGSRSEVSIDRAWHFISGPERSHLAAVLPHISNTDDEGEPIDGYRIDQDRYGLTGKDTWEWHISQNRGNVLRAAGELWLEGGVLYGQEEEFLKILELAGMKNVRYEDPNRSTPAIVPVYLSIQNPLDTSNISKDVIASLEKASKRRRGRQHGVDHWDKRAVAGSHWIDLLHDSIKNEHTNVWTTIPDWVTDVLKAYGYDGIRDKGGKYSDVQHTVWVPFEEIQIKSATSNKGTYSTVKPGLRESLAARVLRGLQ